MDVGKLTATLSLNLKQFTVSIGEAVKEVRGLSSKLDDALGPNGVQKQVRNTQNSIQALGGSFKDLDRIVSGILISQLFYNAVNGIQDATVAVTRFINNMERAQIAMEYFLGSAEKAQGFIANMKDFAAVTAFSTEQALVLSRRLMGAQFKPENIRSIMEILNDASAATGGTPEQMDRIVLAMTQIKTQGKLAGQEVRQLAEAGVPIYTLLQEELGLTADQLSNLGDLAIDGDTAVAAVLKGLEKRYKGAADRLADTLPGLWDTIKDDALMFSERLFAGPHQALKNFLHTWRDGMERMRDILTTSGLGGVFEAFVPKELQTAIRNIIGSMQSLAGSFKMVFEALKPVAAMLLGSLVQGLGAVLPVIASVVRVIAQLISAAINANPWIQALTAAVMGLMVAGAAAKALMFLWSVTRLGVLSAVVGQAVMILVRAIQFLTLVLARNPWTGLIMLAAAAFLYLAMSSKTVTQWLDKVTEKLSSMAGINIDGILKPENNEAMTKWTEDFNKRLDTMSKNLKGVGTSAKKTGKQVKDTFVASFDELYQVPEVLEDMNKDVGDLGDQFDMSDFELPKMPKLDFNLGFDAEKPDFSFPPIIEKPGPRPPNDGGGDGGSKIDPPDVAPVTKTLDTVNSLLANMALAITAWSVNTSKTLGTWAVTNAGTLGQWASDGAKLVGGWVVETVGDINGWVTDTSIDFANWSTDRIGDFTTWSEATVTTIGDWAVNTGNALGDWIGDTSKSFGNWAVENGEAIGDWASNAGISISTWATGAVKDIGNWVTTTGEDVGAWALNTGDNIAIWATNTGDNIKTWSKAAAKDIGGWINNTSSNVATWGVNTAKNIASWGSNTASNIGNWAVAASKNVYNWGANTGKNIADWANNATDNIGAWASRTSGSVVDWVKGTAKNVGNWVDATSGNLADWANNGIGAIESWAKGSWGTMKSWLSGTASHMAGWAQSTIGTIVSWAQSAWSTIKSLASAVGAEVGSWFGATERSISNTYSAMADWTSQNKSWLAPVAAGAVVVGAAALTAATAGAAAPALAAALVGAPIIMSSMDSLPSIRAAQYERGGIIDTEQFARIGEKNRREAVIPMENSNYMKPFSQAVANDLIEFLEDSGFGNNSDASDRPILYVGTLIADDKSLKELYRKMEVIAVGEKQRKGLAPV